MTTPQKIAVLGGGTGSLGALFALTSEPDWQTKYDITVYQLGWRVGGKGASGRQQDMDNRIEEHGLHIWFGFYNESFKMIQQCYDEMKSLPQKCSQPSPLMDWTDAFKPHNHIGVEEYYDGHWEHWVFDFPPNDKVPGTGEDNFTVLGAINSLLTLVDKQFEQILQKGELPEQAKMNDEQLSVEIMELLKSQPLLSELENIHAELQQLGSQRGQLGILLRAMSNLIGQFENRLTTLTESERKQYLSELHLLSQQLLKLPSLCDFLSGDARRLCLLAELAVVVIAGFISEGVIPDGDFQKISDIDLRDWLREYGASETLAYSAFPRAIYDLFFSFPNGYTGNEVPSKEGNMSARPSLHYMSRAIFGYKGAIMWKMQAGMGDVVFTPLYRVLKARGVKFKFFHNVTDLILNEDDTQIAEIRLNKQVRLKDEGDEGIEYDPLYCVDGLPCWPSKPLYDQIDDEDANALQAQNINLESYWTPWDRNTEITLKLGTDFDTVLCGISISALNIISSQLSAANPKWKQMVDNVQTVRTLAMQDWLTKTLPELGWTETTAEESIILDAYVEPFNTWADMPQTLTYESWPPGEEQPKNVAYFCGPMPDTVGGSPIPPPGQQDFPAEASDWVKQEAISWITENITYLWPTFEWNDLADPQQRSGEERFNAQYWRSNIDPTERYVLAVAGTEAYRLKPDESGFNNLFLVGDWVNNDFMNIGAIEPTVIGALKAAEAIKNAG